MHHRDPGLRMVEQHLLSESNSMFIPLAPLRRDLRFELGVRVVLPREVHQRFGERFLEERVVVRRDSVRVRAVYRRG